MTLENDAASHWCSQGTDLLFRRPRRISRRGVVILASTKLAPKPVAGVLGVARFGNEIHARPVFHMICARYGLLGIGLSWTLKRDAAIIGEGLQGEKVCVG
jgi:hypothetical protein